MRYNEPKERSAELLRLALARMGQHTAAFNPLTFTLWYEVVSGTNPRLSAAVDALQQQGQVIDDHRVLQLCREHVFPPDEDSLDSIRDEMQQLMLGVQQRANETSLHAGDYGAQLGAFSAVLAAGEGNASALRPKVDDVMAGTVRMKQSVDELRQQVDMSQHEVERLRLALDRARSEALVDPLTGVLNRKGFDQKLRAMLSSEPPSGTSHVLVMLDIDHFKRVNDTHGHLIGDRVIQGLGEILRTTVKAPQGLAARYGGEEFAILFPQVRLADSHQVTEAVRARTKALKIRNRQTQEVLVTVTVSGGVASWRPGDDADDLVARADAALYKSKQAGRDRITLA
jgi:diguanylate cyclase